MGMRETLQKLMELHGDNDYTLEAKSGVHQPTIHRYLSGKHKSLSEANVEKLARAYHIKPSQLRGDLPILEIEAPTAMPAFARSKHSVKQESPDYSQPEKSFTKYIKNFFKPSDGFLEIPLMNANASMGSGSDQPHDDVVIDVLRISKSWVEKSLPLNTGIMNLAFIHAIGDSMSPTFSDGDILLVDTGVKQASIDGVFVLEAHERLFVKRVRQRIDGSHEISSDNPNVKTVDILNGDHAVRIMGRVLWVWNGKRL
jgi:phage repressor protein C with HTH and peptisase S24 domain